jgi:hypothetical protein
MKWNIANGRLVRRNVYSESDEVYETSLSILRQFCLELILHSIIHVITRSILARFSVSSQLQTSPYFQMNLISPKLALQQRMRA